MTDRIVNVTKTRTIILNYPIEIKENGDLKIIDKVTISRLKAKHLEVVPPSLMGGKGKNINPKEVIPFVGAICGLSKDECGELDFEDLESIIEVLSDFLSGASSQKIGKR